jgi:hypothetical protein
MDVALGGRVRVDSWNYRFWLPDCNLNLGIDLEKQLSEKDVVSLGRAIIESRKENDALERDLCFHPDR